MIHMKAFKTILFSIILIFGLIYKSQAQEIRLQIGDNLKYGFVDTKGNVIMDFVIDDIGDFEDGMAKFRMGDKYGFISKQGKIIIPCQYENATSFAEGFAKVY